MNFGNHFYEGKVEEMKSFAEKGVGDTENVMLHIISK
jgi:hypothetical protein